MISVLTSLAHVSRAIQRLQLLGCGYHADPFKNWDLSLIADVVDNLDRELPILDVGCGESRCSVLSFLARRGFTELHGVDLRITLPDRLEQFLAMRNRGGLRPPFRLHQADAASTTFAAETFAAVVCLSTIEHGLDLPRFFAEMYRVLRPGGTLLVTTDYWPDPIDVGGRTAWGLPWRIFSRADVDALVAQARDKGFVADPADVPRPEERVIHWGGAAYSFLALTFEKPGVGPTQVGAVRP